MAGRHEVVVSSVVKGDPAVFSLLTEWDNPARLPRHQCGQGGRTQDLPVDAGRALRVSTTGIERAAARAGDQ